MNRIHKQSINWSIEWSSCRHARAFISFVWQWKREKDYYYFFGKKKFKISIANKFICIYLFIMDHHFPFDFQIWGRCFLHLAVFLVFVFIFFCFCFFLFVCFYLFCGSAFCIWYSTRIEIQGLTIIIEISMIFWLVWFWF